MREILTFSQQLFEEGLFKEAPCKGEGVGGEQLWKEPPEHLTYVKHRGAHLLLSTSVWHNISDGGDR